MHCEIGGTQGPLGYANALGATRLVHWLILVAPSCLRSHNARYIMLKSLNTCEIVAPEMFHQTISMISLCICSFFHTLYERHGRRQPVEQGHQEINSTYIYISYNINSWYSWDYNVKIWSANALYAHCVQHQVFITSPSDYIIFYTDYWLPQIWCWWSGDIIQNVWHQ